MKKLIDLLKSSQYILYISVLEKLSFFLLFVLLAREFNIQFYGELRATFVFVNIILMALELGFSNYIQREVAVDNRELKNELSTILSFKLIIFFLFSIIVLIYHRGNTWITQLQIIIIILVFYISSFNNLLSRFFFGKNDYSKVFKLFFVARVLFILEILKGFIWGYTLTEILLVLLISNLFIFILFSYLLSQSKIRINYFELKTGMLKRVLISSLPIGIGIFFVWIYDRLDVLLVQGFLGDSSVSFYTVAYSLYKIPQLFAGILLIPLYTGLSKEYNSNGRISSTTITAPVTILIGLSLVSIIICLCLSDKVLPFLYSQKYSDSVAILNLLVFALPGLLLNNTTGVILNSCRKEKIPLYATLVGLIINFGINIIFLNMLNLLAAVIATIVTEYVILFIQAGFIFKYQLLDFKVKLKYSV